MHKKDREDCAQSGLCFYLVLKQVIVTSVMNMRSFSTCGVLAVWMGQASYRWAYVHKCVQRWKWSRTQCSVFHEAIEQVARNEMVWGKSVSQGLPLYTC